MSEGTLEERVARLETQVAALLHERDNGPVLAQPGRDVWRETVGMFRDDPVFSEMIDEAVCKREDERQHARRQTGSDST